MSLISKDEYTKTDRDFRRHKETTKKEQSSSQQGWN